MIEVVFEILATGDLGIVVVDHLADGGCTRGAALLPRAVVPPRPLGYDTLSAVEVVIDAAVAPTALADFHAQTTRWAWIDYDRERTVSFAHLLLHSADCGHHHYYYTYRSRLQDRLAAVDDAGEVAYYTQEKAAILVNLHHAVRSMDSLAAKALAAMYRLLYVITSSYLLNQ